MEEPSRTACSSHPAAIRQLTRDTRVDGQQLARRLCRGLYHGMSSASVGEVEDESTVDAAALSPSLVMSVAGGAGDSSHDDREMIAR